MARRRVTRTGKDYAGDITKLCGAWGSALKSTAISHIESGLHSYYVEDSWGRTADVQVYQTWSGKHLRTDPDSSCSNNLDNLPNC
ncbi:MAG: DUF3892 domain-containing protein [Acidimicrobiia bacterium]|nr:DUF3892 domain-containing protein [Acidimicrobiia bacterium]MYF83452.1 DUF3892 domain-containing protein [Acidimicrobiia bacterium]